MTKELTQEVEDGVMELCSLPYKNNEDVVRSILMSIAERAEARGKEQAEFENKKLQEMTAYSEGAQAMLAKCNETLESLKFHSTLGDELLRQVAEIGWTRYGFDALTALENLRPSDELA